MVVQLSMFNDSTGVVNNSINWAFPDSTISNYVTVEFSPDSRLLYTGIAAQSLVLFTFQPYTKLLQFDISSHSVPAILFTEIQLFQEQQLYGGAILSYRLFANCTRQKNLC